MWQFDRVLYSDPNIIKSTRLGYTHFNTRILKITQSIASKTQSNLYLTMDSRHDTYSKYHDILSTYNIFYTPNAIIALPRG